MPENERNEPIVLGGWKVVTAKEFEWNCTILKIREKMPKYSSIIEVAADIGISPNTLRKVLKGRPVSTFCTIQIEEWVKK